MLHSQQYFRPSASDHCTRHPLSSRSGRPARQVGTQVASNSQRRPFEGRARGPKLGVTCSLVSVASLPPTLYWPGNRWTGS